MTGTVAVVEYGPRLEDQHRDFTREMWPTKVRRSDPGYIRWKFRSAGEETVPGLLLAVEGLSVLGQLGVLPVTLATPVGPVAGCWACDLMVSPRARGRGVATALFRAALERSKLIVGSDASPGAHAVMSRLGFVEQLGPWRLLFPLAPRQVARFVTHRGRGPVRRLVSLLFAVGLWGWTAITPRQRRGDGGPREWRRAVDTLLDREVPEGWWGVVHDEEFWRWRFAPPERFRRAVYGYEAEGTASAIVEVDERSASVSDWRAAGRSQASRVIGPAVEAARRAGGTMVRAYAQTPHERRWLMSLGFVPRSSRVRVLVDPRVDRALLGKPWRYTYCDSDENI